MDFRLFLTALDCDNKMSELGLTSKYASLSENHRTLPKIIMRSGLEVSIQASEYHYCEPRETIKDLTEYRKFELGFPNQKIDSIMQYAEDESEPTETVYGYVPYNVIQEFIDLNGGIVGFIKNGVVYK